MKTAKFDFFELLSRVFWICIAASAVSIAYLSIFIFQSSLVSLVLTAVLYAVGLAGIISYRAQKLILDRKTIEIHEANRLYQSTVEALASAIDARDQIGRGRLRKIAHKEIFTGDGHELLANLIIVHWNEANDDLYREMVGLQPV